VLRIDLWTTNGRTQAPELAASLKIPAGVADVAQAAWLSDNLHSTTVSPVQRQVAAELRALGELSRSQGQCFDQGHFRVSCRINPVSANIPRRGCHACAAIPVSVARRRRFCPPLPLLVTLWPLFGPLAGHVPSFEAWHRRQDVAEAQAMPQP